MVSIGIVLLMVAFMTINVFGSGMTAKRFWNAADWVGAVSGMAGAALLSAGVVVYAWRALP